MSINRDDEDFAKGDDYGEFTYEDNKTSKLNTLVTL